MRKETAKLLALPCLMWLGTALLAYPHRWNDQVGVQIFFAVLVLPPIFAWMAGKLLIAQAKVDIKNHVFEPWHEPESGVFSINASPLGVRLVISGAIGAFAYKMLPFFKSPLAAPLAVGLCLAILLLEYRDFLDLQSGRRITRLSFGLGPLQIPLWSRTLEISPPYLLSWGYRYEKGGEYSRGGWRLHLGTPNLPHPLHTVRDAAPLEQLNEQAQAFASWQRGRIFDYSPLQEPPAHPKKP